MCEGSGDLLFPSEYPPSPPFPSPPLPTCCYLWQLVLLVLLCALMFNSGDPSRERGERGCAREPTRARQLRNSGFYSTNMAVFHTWGLCLFVPEAVQSPSRGQRWTEQVVRGRAQAVAFPDPGRRRGGGVNINSLVSMRDMDLFSFSPLHGTPPLAPGTHYPPSERNPPSHNWQRC